MDSTLGRRIYRARKAQSLAQDDVAVACGVRRLTVASWESNTTVPRVDDLMAMADRLGVAPAWLLTGEGRGPDDAPSAAASASA